MCLPRIHYGIPYRHKLHQGKRTVEVKHNIAGVNGCALVYLAVADGGNNIAIVNGGTFIYLAVTNGH